MAFIARKIENSVDPGPLLAGSPRMQGKLREQTPRRGPYCKAVTFVFIEPVFGGIERPTQRAQPLDSGSGDMEILTTSGRRRDPIRNPFSPPISLSPKIAIGTV